ncbi:MAG TPA: GAF domain-containing protein [Armatimonadetes bacterium]|nr:GAF domain-containing protein [Armatimonadota bacterium]
MSEHILYLAADVDVSALRAVLEPAGIRCVPLRVEAESLALPAVVVAQAEVLSDGAPWLASLRSPEAAGTQIIVLAEADGPSVAVPEEFIFATLPPTIAPPQLGLVVRRAFERGQLQRREQALAHELHRRSQELGELNRIGIALSAEREVDKLLELILQKSREITQADAGSLYLVEETPEEQHLRFKLSQNDSFDISYTEFIMPLDKASLAGYVAVTGKSLLLDDVYELGEGVEYSFNRSFDESTGYRTKSMLVVPMKNNFGEIRGVIQLINRKPAFDLRLRDAAMIEQVVIPFDENCQELALSLASQAAVALENSLLLRNIEEIFERFLEALVKAIEDRDPATAGHSLRVTRLTLALAEAVNKTTEGPYAQVHFTPAQMKELRYAGMLHDVGKIYVRPEVFVKAKKLYSHHLKTIQERFEFVRKSLEAEYTRRKLEYVISGKQDYQEHFRALDEKYRHELQLLDEYFQIILLANEPTVLAADSFERLAQIAARTYVDAYGHSQKLLQLEELKLLSIQRGSLDETERREIESHVEWSFKLLVRIPWTKDLANIPFIAGAHHEKLDGSGYPHHLTAEQIPLQAKMMAIADVFDALTAADRPYKKAVPVERALDILRYEAEARKIDKDLVDIFIRHRVCETTLLE